MPDHGENMAATARLDALIEKVRQEPRILIIDIETMAPLVYTWSLRKANIGLNQIVKPGRVICFAAKWHGEHKTMFHSEHAVGHPEMVMAAHRLMDEADVVVHYNGTRFDVKHLNREFELLDLGRPSPHINVDLMTEWSKSFVTSTGSRKLDAVLMELGLERKLDTGGFELWFDCDQDDPAAWRKMKRYNVQDVKSTEALFDRIRPWIKSMPHQGLYGGNRAGCPRCGSMQMSQQGYTTTATGRYARWKCGDCGGFFKGTHRVEAVHHAVL